LRNFLLRSDIFGQSYYSVYFAIIRSYSTDKLDLTNRSRRSSEREVKSVDNVDTKSTFGSCADSAEHGEQ